jgi:predicted nucleic acid-binding protein
VQLVIADTGPINYLVLIGHIGILPALFRKVILPAAVHDELCNVDTPEAVRGWIANAPGWIEIRHSTSPAVISELGAGESEAITLALELHADLLLMDDRRGVKVARERRIAVTGTLGVLARALRMLFPRHRFLKWDVTNDARVVQGCCRPLRRNTGCVVSPTLCRFASLAPSPPRLPGSRTKSTKGGPPDVSAC